MNITDNYYQEADYRYTEIGIALTDFTYGSTVSISIPTITPFMNTSKEVTTTGKVSTVNIINDDISALGIDSNNSKKYTTSNSMSLTVPWYLADIETASINGSSYLQPKASGTKGTQFIISFVGGELNKAQIVGRMY